MFLSLNEASSYGSTKSPVGMYCLIKSRQVCKSSMLSPNFTFVKRSLWKPSFKTSCLKIISEQVALMPVSAWEAARAVADVLVNPAASQSSSQATAWTTATAAGAARTAGSVRRRGARPVKCGRRSLHTLRAAPREHCHRAGQWDGSLGERTPSVPRFPQLPAGPAPESSGVSGGCRPGPGIASSRPRPSPPWLGAGRGEAHAP